MIRLVVRRARAQWPLLGCLLAVLTLGATLLGTCALLVTRTSDRAVEVAASRTSAAENSATVYAVTIRAVDARSVATDARNFLTSTVAPFDATTTTRVSTVMQRLPAASDTGRGLLSEGYLSAVDDLERAATLVAGHWPRAGARQAALFDTTARLLGLDVGDTVRLGAPVGSAPARPIDLTVVGLVHPRPDAGWDRDPLHGAGFDPDPTEASYAPRVNAYGPFLTPLEDLLSAGSSIDQLEVTARLDLASPTGRELDQLDASLAGADRRLSALLGDRADYDRVNSPIPDVIHDALRQRELVSGSVLAFALVGALLAACALALAGRLAVAVRGDEQALFTALGTSGGQLASIASIEAALLAALATATAIPASSLLHAALTHSAPLSDAGLAASPTATPTQILAALAGASALAVLHVVLALRRVPESDGRRAHRGPLARSSADVLLCGLAAVGWWQLRAQPAAEDTRVDVVRVLAPALILVACVALVLRVLPPVLRRAERLAATSRGLVFPLAAFQAARRPQAFAAGLLIGLACAVATFGTAFGATWTASQHDQADLAVGTDLALALAGPPTAGQGAPIGTATGGVLSPISVRNIAIGQYSSEAGPTPQLVAIDTTQADAVLRGRTDRTWAAVTEPLSPTTRVSGPQFPPAAATVLTGTASAGPVAVAPRLVLQDATGVRTTCSSPPVPLDGNPHPLPACAAVRGLHLVAVGLPVTTDLPPARSHIDVSLTLPGGVTATTADWSVHAAVRNTGQLSGSTITATGTRMRVTSDVSFTDLGDESRVLVATTFPDPGPVPVAISTALADVISAGPGTPLHLSIGTTPIAAEVVGVTPAIPSAPGRPAAIADVDTLSRALITHGDFESPVTGWWVGGPRADAANAIGRLHIGEVTTRASETEQLTRGPLRASLPAVLRMLVAASALLLFAGVMLHVSYDVQRRALEVARLRGLGLSRREIRSALLLEHAAVLGPVLAAGAVIGSAATWVLTPLLIRSDTGAAPVPAVAGHWPWPSIGALLALLVVGTGLAVAAVVRVQARRADAAHLRVAS
ncbi:FtsX-like permease family protein [Cryptosporangium sp. NPDC051539]|uniref:FtsX-like permease family protein n=1 Tax=Cryptosporangium sp. NPDC051539 TaxID=3363962 RepID=UPI00379827FE